MNPSTLLASLAALAFGLTIGWLLSKNRMEVLLTQVRGLIAPLEEKLAERSGQLQQEMQVRKACEEKTIQLGNLNARLQAERAAAAEWHQSAMSDLAGAHAANERLQAELNRILQEKASLARDVVNANESIRALKEKEAIHLEEIANHKSQVLTLSGEKMRLSAQFEEHTKRLAEQQTFIDGAKDKLNVSFQALSAQALEQNNASFVTLAKETLETKLKEAQGDLEKKEEAIRGLVQPLGESLKSMDSKINELEKTRVGAYRDVYHFMDQVKQSAEALRKETGSLAGALKTSHTRGRYGEIALRRLVEFAGMLEHCHFKEQVTVEDEGGKLRPDMVINLPENKMLVLDSKVPMAAYNRMFEAESETEKAVQLQAHARAVRDHLKKLSAKAYWSQFSEAPDFVILFMPIESAYGAALQAEPELIEEAFRSRLIIATPTILISILMSVGYSWNQLKTMENIEEIRTAAVDLYERSTIFIDHIVSLGNSLNGAVTHYNKSIGSLESYFMPQAKRINQLSNAYTKKILKELEPIEMVSRKYNKPLPEFRDGTFDQPLNQ